MHIDVLIFCDFSSFSVWKRVQDFWPLTKITVFPGNKKVGLNCPTFIRGDPYEPHRPHEKVTFSDHQFGWFWASESCKSLCLASILVRYEVPTRFLNLPPITPIFIGWGKICPPPGPYRTKNGSNRVNLRWSCYQFVLQQNSLILCCRRKFHTHCQVVNPSTPPNNATVGPVLGASVGVAVYDSLLNVSQAGAGYNTQIAVAKSLSEVAPRSF